MRSSIYNLQFYVGEPFPLAKGECLLGVRKVRVCLGEIDSGVLILSHRQWDVIAKAHQSRFVCGIQGGCEGAYFQSEVLSGRRRTVELLFA